VILGASFDTPSENLAFAEAQNFPFRLLSDVDQVVGTTYEVVRAPGEKYPEYPRRHSYLIDPDGRIHRRYEVTDVASHAADVIRDLEAAQTET
jgi:peroxiredoxin Q/BCP